MMNFADPKDINNFEFTDQKIYEFCHDMIPVEEINVVLVYFQIDDNNIATSLQRGFCFEILYRELQPCKASTPFCSCCIQLLW